MVIPHVIPGLWPEPVSAARFAGLIRRDAASGCEIGLIGLADDLGVRLNGGRPGAREGPRAFREALARYGVGNPHGWNWPRVFDAGDIIPAEGSTEDSLHETHRRVSEAVGALLDLGLFPVGIGGGHDLTFPFVRAVAAREGHLGVVYADAHLDVREKPGSGMAFRALVERGGVRWLQIVGFDPFVNSREHYEWFRQNGGWSPEYGSVDEPSSPPSDPLHFSTSLDLDVVDAAFAPGVSAMNPRGWNVDHACTFARTNGMDPRCRAFDLMELCPAHDENGRTARLAARLFLEFLRGFGQRPSRRGEPG